MTERDEQDAFDARIVAAQVRAQRNAIARKGCGPCDLQSCDYPRCLPESTQKFLRETEAP